MDMTELKFCGRIMRIAEEEFAASASDELAEALYKQWCQEAVQSTEDAWIRSQLASLFPAVGDRPIWVRPDCPQWPYHNSRPMVFLGQIDLPEFTLPTGEKSTPESVYVFGAAEMLPGSQGSWKFIKRIVEQCEL